MTPVEVQQAGVATRQLGGPPQLAGVLWLTGGEQHIEPVGLGRAESVPGLGLLAVAEVISERAWLECEL